jgi:hyaluronan synthase
MQYVSLAMLVTLVAAHPATLLRILLAVGVMSFLNTLYYLHSERSPDFFYGIFYVYFSMFTLFWIFPYAVFTVRARGWLTR